MAGKRLGLANRPFKCVVQGQTLYCEVNTTVSKPRHTLWISKLSFPAVLDDDDNIREDLVVNINSLNKKGYGPSRTYLPYALIEDLLEQQIKRYGEIQFDDNEPMGIFSQVEVYIMKQPRTKLKRSVRLSVPVIPCTLQDISPALNRLDEYIDKWMVAEGYDVYHNLFLGDFAQYTVTYFNLGILVFRRSVGCKGGWGEKGFPLTLVKGKLHDPASSDYNCFFACLLSCHGLVNVLQEHVEDLYEYDWSEQAKKLREYFLLDPGPLEKNDIQNIMFKLNVNLDMYGITNMEDEYCDQEIKLLYSLNWFTSNITVRLLINRSHCALIDNINKLLKFRRCKTCKKWYSYNSKSARLHFLKCKRCVECNCVYNSSDHCCKGRELSSRAVSTVRKNKKLHLSRMVEPVLYFADFECFTPQKNKEMVVYASAILKFIDLDESKDDATFFSVRCNEFYGSGGFDNFCRHLLSLSGIVIYYNGARFDFYFIFDWLVENHIPIKNLHRDAKCNRILCIEFGNVKLWDLCLFTAKSLSMTCKNLGVPKKFRKKEFNHDLIRSWDDVEKYKADVLYYIRYDVISLAIAYKIFSKVMFDLYKVNIIETMTLSHWAYEVWRNTKVPAKLIHTIVLPTREIYDIIHHEALFGGRCMPQRKYFKTANYDLDYHPNHWKTLSADQRLKLLEDLRDYLVLLDVVSLYPAASVFGRYPSGNPRLSRDDVHRGRFLALLQKSSDVLTNREIQCLQRAFLRVDVICPQHLLTPFLFARNKNGGLDQDLLPKYYQVYDGNTIMEAMRLGYKFVAVHEIILYPKLSNPVAPFMLHAFKQKQLTNKNTHPVQYEVHKLAMNGLTGKFNQQLYDGEWHITYDDLFLSQLERVDQCRSIEWIYNGNGELLCYLVETAKGQPPNKPAQIGSNILAVSRIIMSYYLSFVGGYTDPDCMSYYGDTDSLILHGSVYEHCRDLPGGGQVFGSELGQLSDEFNGGKIIKAVFIAPKSYILEYITNKGVLKWKVAVKGIPHPEREIDVEEYYKYFDREIEDILTDTSEHVQKLVKKLRKKNLALPTFNLIKDGNIIATRLHLNMYFFEHMIFFDSQVVVYYGSMRRRIAGAQTGFRAGTIELIKQQHRAINETIWWKSGKRSNSFDITYPKGHYKWPYLMQQQTF